MKEINQKLLTINRVIVLVIILFIMMNNISMRRNYRHLEREIDELNYQNIKISDKLDKIIDINSIISEVDYNIEKVEGNKKGLGKITIDITSNKLGLYSNLKLLYRIKYDSTKPKDYNYSNENWNDLKLNNNNGSYSTEFTAAYSSNYELRIAYGDDGNLNYEKLPDLDLYTKAEHSIIKDINIYNLNKSKVEFDVQIAKMNDNVEIVSATCNTYYNDKIIDITDILKQNEISGRKEPRNQLEHMDGDYLFIIKEIDFNNIEKFEESKFKIEVIIEDSLGNRYELIEDIK